MSLQRLVLTFTREGIEIRTLYRTKATSGPGTKARQREVLELTRAGLEQALEALQSGRVHMVGTSGYTTREDVLCIADIGGASFSVHKKRKKGA